MADLGDRVKAMIEQHKEVVQLLERKIELLEEMIATSRSRTLPEGWIA